MLFKLNLNPLKLSFNSLFNIQKRCLIYKTIYKGPFDYKRDHTGAYKYPFGVNKSAIEDEFQEINQIRQMEIKDVSPFHLVWRYKTMNWVPWNEKFVLSHLGLHQKEVGIRVVLPNTPHFNRLLWQVKHLIKLKPVSFPDGIPTEEDIGCVKVLTHSGTMSINKANKVSKERLDSSKSDDIFYGRYLREYLKWSSGLIGGGLPHADILELDGNNIEEYEYKMRNANKHQHHLYQDSKQKYWK